MHTYTCTPHPLNLTVITLSQNAHIMHHCKFAEISITRVQACLVPRTSLTVWWTMSPACCKSHDGSCISYVAMGSARFTPTVETKPYQESTVLMNVLITF